MFILGRLLPVGSPETVALDMQQRQQIVVMLLQHPVLRLVLAGPVLVLAMFRAIACPFCAIKRKKIYKYVKKNMWKIIGIC